MKKFNVGLVGYGKMGKIYIKEINKNKNFRVIEILRHKNSKKETNIIKKFFIGDAYAGSNHHHHNCR